MPLPPVLILQFPEPVSITVLRCDTLYALIPDYENDSYSFEDKDLYIPFYYGLRYGKYTGNFSNENVNGKGTFSSTNTDGVVLQIKWSFFNQIILNYFRNVAYYICRLPVTGYADYLLLKIPHAN